jgi:S1-C subfamily serine protease
MIKVSHRPVFSAFRSETPFEGSGHSDLVTAVPQFGGTPSFEDIINRREDMPLNDAHARGNWNSDKDEEHSYLTDPNYKFEEKLREMLERSKSVPPQEQWEAVDSEGKKYRFYSLNAANRKARENGVHWKTVRKIASRQVLASHSAEIVAKAINACVMVRSVPNDGDRPELGSGFGIGNNLVVTCAHVIKRYNKMLMPAGFTSQTATVTINQMGRQAPAELVACSLELDLAILRSTMPLGSLRLGAASSTPNGTEVIAIGCPKGFENNISSGVLSSQNRKIFNFNGAPTYIFTDAQVMPGSSGGALIEQDSGNVIGVISLIVAGVGLYGLNAALPGETVINFMKEKGLL